MRSDEVDPGGDAGRLSGHDWQEGGLAGNGDGSNWVNCSVYSFINFVIFFLGKLAIG